MSKKNLKQKQPESDSEEEYDEMDELSHVLERSDMYVGSTRLRTSEEYVAVKGEEGWKIVKKEIKSCPAILRVFAEALSNALDNAARSKNTKTKMTTFKVSIDKKTGRTSVWNDGKCIPIKKNAKTKLYNHSLIFGRLRTGSNYNDSKKRETSGRNGLGIKLNNIFSKTFTVKGSDPTNKKVFEQTWSNNMTEVGEPIVEEGDEPGFTEVSWIPDFERFDLKGYTSDIIALYTKFVIDASMICGIEVELNGEPVGIASLADYAALYPSPSEEQLLITTKDCKVLVTTSEEFSAISFVNGVYTKLGGVHVDAWCEAILRPLVDKFNKKPVKKSPTSKPKDTKKKAGPQVTIKDVKQFFRFFIVSTVENPEFDGQEKHRLEAPEVKAEVKTTHINAIKKWSVIEDIENLLKSKEMTALKKTERKRGFAPIPGFDPANKAGTKDSHLCTLILCEGLSAKTFAVSGIEKGVYGKSGRDWFGIYPLRGKLLNVRNSTPTTIAANKVCTNLVQAIGLSHGVDYTEEENYKKLRYGRVLIITDSDVDGIHIEGLLLNFFNVLFPSLMERMEPYINSMKTPIARVFQKGGKDLLFYDQNRYDDFLKKHDQKINAKYYKGLGTIKEEDAPEMFAEKMIEFIPDEEYNHTMAKVFHVKKTDDRKAWLENYNPTAGLSLDDAGKTVAMNISDFIDTELIKYSLDDCRRNIASLVDGLKESQRKILYAVLKRNLKYSGKSLKVAQLGGYVAEHTNYHHGEDNLYKTITKMANEFPGSNNIPLFYRDGQFGSRLSGGEDAASPRYIFTKMEPVIPYIFRSEDKDLLEQRVDDGDVVEPFHYVPIIPMILVNGSHGIGTAWSSDIPAYNPEELVECVKIWLDNEGEILIEDEGTEISMLPDIKPWARGHIGEVTKKGQNYTSHGVIEKGEKNNVIIRELPIGTWTDTFKEKLEELLTKGQIKNFQNHSTPKKVSFTITECPDGMSVTEKNLNLTSSITTTNLVLHDEKDALIKLKSIDHIIDMFCRVRMDFYVKRKKHIIGRLEEEMRFLGNKERFIREVMSKELDIMNVPEAQIIKNLEKSGYDKQLKPGAEEEIEDDDEDSSKSKGYNYLLHMQIRTFTAEKVKSIQKDVASKKKELATTKKTSEKEMWERELDEFLVEYKKWLKTMEESDNVYKKASSSKKPGKK